MFKLHAIFGSLCLNNSLLRIHSVILTF